MNVSLREKIGLYAPLLLEKELLEKIIRTKSERMSIADLSTMGYIVPIKRGVIYLNKLSNISASPFIIGAAYMGKERYMIGGTRVYNMYNFTTQLAEVTDIYTLSYSRELTIDKGRYSYHKVQPDFLFGYEDISLQEINIHVMTRERAFIEFVRERILQPNSDFLEIARSLNMKKLQNLVRQYPLKNVCNKIAQIIALCTSKK